MTLLWISAKVSWKTRRNISSNWLWYHWFLFLYMYIWENEREYVPKQGRDNQITIESRGVCMLIKQIGSTGLLYILPQETFSLTDWQLYFAFLVIQDAKWLHFEINLSLNKTRYMTLLNMVYGMKLDRPCRSNMILLPWIFLICTPPSIYGNDLIFADTSFTHWACLSVGSCL